MEHTRIQLDKTLLNFSTYLFLQLLCNPNIYIIILDSRLLIQGVRIVLCEKIKTKDHDQTAMHHGGRRKAVGTSTALVDY